VKAGFVGNVSGKKSESSDEESMRAGVGVVDNINDVE